MQIERKANRIETSCLRKLLECVKEINDRKRHSDLKGIIVTALATTTFQNGFGPLGIQLCYTNDTKYSYSMCSVGEEGIKN